MEKEILKGNFNVKNPLPKSKNTLVESAKLSEEVKKRALASLGGSMVYVERNRLIWDGNDQNSNA